MLLGIEDLHLTEGRFQLFRHPQLDMIRRGDSASNARVRVIEEGVGLSQ
jgi:hypothetical protein